MRRTVGQQSNVTASSDAWSLLGWRRPQSASPDILHEVMMSTPYQQFQNRYNMNFVTDRPRELREELRLRRAANILLLRNRSRKLVVENDVLRISSFINDDGDKTSEMEMSAISTCSRFLGANTGCGAVGLGRGRDMHIRALVLGMAMRVDDMWTQMQVITVLLVAAASAAAAAHLDEPVTEVEAARKGTKMLYYAAPWIFAFKVKVVIVAVAITLFIIKWWVPFGGYGGYTSYSAGPGEAWSEYPGHPGNEAPEMTYRATMTDDVACSARLACEARREARSNPIAANMVSAISSSLDQMDVSKRSEDCESFNCHLAVSSKLKSSRRR
ncbi:hypothetical protein B566_EDAN003136 [Ephemera danica]|nr:hypothetical protein B566_EDAN003136 [Ephemera danica]